MRHPAIIITSRGEAVICYIPPDPVNGAILVWNATTSQWMVRKA